MAEETEDETMSQFTGEIVQRKIEKVDGDDEIIEYLSKHPEIDHFCVLDDNDTKTVFHWDETDLEKVADYLVEVLFYSYDNPEKEGLLEEHREQIGKILKKDINIKGIAERKLLTNKE